MRYSFTDLPTLQAAGFDTIIDVRSPAEFAEDHLPGAVNMPVLSDAERAQVGTIYTQESPFKARKIGAALVARNAAHAIETHLIGHDGGWRPLVYCWRGGQRSGSFASILAQIGWRVAVLDGGYRTWRRHVVTQLYETPLPHRFMRLDGLTGTGKTQVLRRLAAATIQTIDLEALANHRGSVLGAATTAQPAQKGFETALAAALAALDPARPVVVEAEASRIGDLRLPPTLWSAMKASPRVVLNAPRAARAAFLAADYARLAASPDRLKARLAALAPHVGRARVAEWHAMADAGAHRVLAESLIEHHYDPAYRRARCKDPGPLLSEQSMGALAAADLQGAADAIGKTVAALTIA